MCRQPIARGKFKIVGCEVVHHHCVARSDHTVARQLEADIATYRRLLVEVNGRIEGVEKGHAENTEYVRVLRQEAELLRKEGERLLDENRTLRADLARHRRWLDEANARVAELVEERRHTVAPDPISDPQERKDDAAIRFSLIELDLPK